MAKSNSKIPPYWDTNPADTAHATCHSSKGHSSRDSPTTVNVLLKYSTGWWQKLWNTLRLYHVSVEKQPRSSRINVMNPLQDRHKEGQPKAESLEKLWDFNKDAARRGRLLPPNTVTWACRPHLWKCWQKKRRGLCKTKIWALAS